MSKVKTPRKGRKGRPVLLLAPGDTSKASAQDRAGLPSDDDLEMADPSPDVAAVNDPPTPASSRVEVGEADDFSPVEPVSKQEFQDAALVDLTPTKAKGRSGPALATSKITTFFYLIRNVCPPYPLTPATPAGPCVKCRKLGLR